MSITQTSFLRTSALLLIVGLIALMGIIGSTLWLMQRTQHYFNEVIEARDLRGVTNNLRITLQEAESGQRGFLLTGAEDYLDTYNVARDNILPFFERLRSVADKHPEYLDRLERLGPELKLKLAEMEETIRLVREGQRDAAIAIVATDRGKEIMDEARTLFRQIVAEADESLTAGVNEQHSNAGLLRAVAVAGGFLIIVVVGGSIWTAVAYTRELLSARAEVEELNAGLEQRVVERTQELTLANEEVQRFAYIVTHDLRAPLVNIMGFTSELNECMKSIQAYVLAEGEPLDEQQIHEARTAASEDLPEAIGFIRSSTRKMDRLINAILKISRDGKRPLKPETIDLGALLEANLDAVHHQVANADGTTHLAVEVPAIISDRLSLEQIVGNLIDNAVKYRAPTRPLRIDVSVNRARGHQVRIDISDNGRGIPPEDHQRVFDLFRRSGEQTQPGEGIGLAHVRALVRSLGGDIKLSSQFGKGTTFSILLPLDVRTIIRSSQA